MARDVRFDDLDLRTAHGARELKARIRYTARTLCNRLDALYPVTADGSPDCYATTLNDAMQQADAAIGAARHYSSNE